MVKENFSPSKTMPLDVGIIHLIGIGGIGISGIAEILNNLGYQVQGSDMSENYNVERLRLLGIKVFIGHKAENIDGVSVVVISTAVKPDNPEVVAAKKSLIPVVKRSEMLAEITRLKSCIAIAGTHGKTTTTALCSAILTEADFKPTTINGGIINSVNTNAFIGSGDWMVVEADESDGTFIKIPSTIGIITNIDPEHLDYYGTFDEVKKSYRIFIERLPFYGFAVMCVDHPAVKELAEKITERKIYTYAIENAADVKAENIRVVDGLTTFDVVLSKRITKNAERKIKDIKLAIPGLHNVLNSLSAIAVATQLKISEEKIKSALEKFSGVKRRFTKTGEVNGLTIIDDYGHHPKEISATLSAARTIADSKKSRVIAVVQPHRFTRLRDLFTEFSECFSAADEVIISDVYTAGEQPIEGVNSLELIKKIKTKTKAPVHHLASEKDLAKLVWSVAKSGDLVVCLGAGSITYWANALPSQLAHIFNSSAA